MKIIKFSIMFLLLLATVSAGVWVPDLGNGRYKNPILFADYSDPDVTRVGGDFYMVASSFNAMPGIPVLHSRDLVNWTIIGHVYDRLPFQDFDKPNHGNGSWAPSIRYHDGTFYVYFCTPYHGLFMASTRDPAGEWDLHHVADVELWEDPCPFWDDDGNAYLVRSKLRADILYIHRMSPDGKRLLDNGRVLYENTDRQPVIEGPKVFKIAGWYYILAPGGGVPTGWQAALRSKNIYGPYEDKVVMHQGSTPVNGPHQGGLVELESGQWWFVHFQDRGVYGRVVHLQPVEWKDGWPLIGEDIDGDGIGEPVLEHAKPDVGQTYHVQIPQTSDEFEQKELAPQWQWQANPQSGWYSLTQSPESLRLYAVKNLTQNGNLWRVPNLLLQKFPAPSFTVTARLRFRPELQGEKAGLVVMGKEWGYISLTRTEAGTELGMYKGTYFQGYDRTEKIEALLLNQDFCDLRVAVSDKAVCRFYYSPDGKTYSSLGKEFQATAGTWIGAKVGLFHVNPNISDSGGFSDFEWFRFE